MSTCWKCNSQWTGFGPICNACKQIEAIEKQSEQSRTQRARDQALFEVTNFTHNDEDLSPRDKDLGKPWWKG